MDESAQTIQIPLTPEQQEMIRRLSGQFAQMLELVPETGDGASGQGRGLQFRWRLSVATGIPRQKWGRAARTLPRPKATHRPDARA